MVEVAYKPLEKVGTIYTGGTLTPPKFMPSYYEWLSVRGLFVSTGGEATSGGNNDIYTVPHNNTLFITYACACITADAVGFSFTSVHTDANPIINVKCSTSGSGNLSISPIIPIKINSGEIITVTCGTNKADAYGNFSGFLVKNADIPTF